MGLATAELWNNLGLCCFHASQYDMCLICFERALALSEDDNSAGARQERKQQNPSCDHHVGITRFGYQSVKQLLLQRQARGSCISYPRTLAAAAAAAAAADIWYNVGQLAIGIGDIGLAYQAFKIAVSVDMNHAESFNNLGVLELRKHNPEAARSNFEGSHKLSEFHFGPCAALLALLWSPWQQPSAASM
jgi:tetratricopeptide (TPR) repeat protein